MTRKGSSEAKTFKDQIAKATLRLVADWGVDRVTTSDVVKTMGITRAAMARHCPTENDLWLAVAALIERRMQQVWSAVAAGQSSPSVRLRSLIAVQMGLIRGMPVLRRILLSGSLHGNNVALRQGLCGVRRGFRTLLVEALVEGRRVGEFHETLNVEATADRILETIQGMVVSWSLGQPAGDPVEEVWARVGAFLHETDRPHSQSTAHSGGAGH